MRRFDESQTLDHLAEAGQIDEALADALGRAVAAAHAAAPASRTRHFAETLAEIIAQNEAELARLDRICFRCRTCARASPQRRVTRSSA